MDVVPARSGAGRGIAERRSVVDDRPSPDGILSGSDNGPRAGVRGRLHRSADGLFGDSLWTIDTERIAISTVWLRSETNGTYRLAPPPSLVSQRHTGTVRAAHPRTMEALHQDPQGPPLTRYSKPSGMSASDSR